MAQSSVQSPYGPASDSGDPIGAAWRWSWPARLAFMFTGVVMPIICFALGYPDRPAWQAGNLWDYAQLLLGRKPSLPLYPFLLYSIICMTLLVVRPNRFVKSFVVRLGIYTGVLLAVQYWFTLLLALAEYSTLQVPLGCIVFSLCAVFIPWLVGWAGVRLFRRFRMRLVWLIGVPVSLILVALGLVATAEGWAGDVAVLPIVVFVFCRVAATPWAVASYAAMAVYAARNSGVKRLRFTLAQLLGVVTWLAAYLGAWRTAVLLMLDDYAKLPTTPPDECYVATAAARGHPGLVGSEDHLGCRGTVSRVNDQMRYLKAGELALAAFSPALHRACRAVYDHVGPRLAARLNHPLLADAAYLSLKPAEWLCRAGMTLLLPGAAELIRRLYATRD